MGKKVLILTGSPRRNGNSFALAEAFIRGAEAAGHEVMRFDAASASILGCRACNQCYRTGQACVFHDDFNRLAPMLEEAEVLALITPLYWFSFPAQIKAAIDKFYALLVGEREWKIRESLLLVTAETGEMRDFDGVVRTFELMNSYLKWKECGRLLVPNVNLPGDIIGTGASAAAEKLGRSL